MADWKNCRNSGPTPWNFVKQYNKWAYLNNPRWLTNARPFVHGGPDDYNGRESEEPQVWEPTNRLNPYSRDNEKTHHQCGHWHTPVLVPTTAPPPLYIPWQSCPMMTIPLGNNGDVLFITTDDFLEKGLGDSTLYVMKYTSATDTWTEIYTETATGESWNDWIEPECFWTKRGTKSVFGIYRAFPDAGDAYGIQILTFDGETLLNNTVIQGGAATALGNIFTNTSQGQLALIDNLGQIHISVAAVKSGVRKLWNYISTDDGATFTPYLVVSPFSLTNIHQRYLMQTSDNKIWQSLSATQVCWSLDNGQTWSAQTPMILSNWVSKVGLCNDVFIAICRGVALADQGKLLFYTSTDCENFTLRFTLDESINGHKKGYLLDSLNMCYDGSFYYVALNLRDDTTGFNVNGQTEIYRSADLITWALVATIRDDKEATPPVYNSGAYSNLDISSSDGELFLSFYYNELESGSLPGVFFLTHWQSSDFGVTWVPITSPFYDLTTGIAP